MADTKMSLRKLADKTNIPESTIRSYLKYADAAVLRSDRAPETADADIADLTQKQVSQYIDLPDSIRDVWLNAGADLDAFSNVPGYQQDRTAYEVNRYKLAEFLEPDIIEFRNSVLRLAKICQWADRHQKLIDLVDYLRPVAARGLEAWVLDLLPCGTDADAANALISPQQWKKILGLAKKYAKNCNGLLRHIESGVRKTLAVAGIDPEDVYSPEVAETLQIVEAAPDFIRAANHLSLDEQCELSGIICEDDEELVLQATQLTCEWLRLAREKAKEHFGQELLGIEPASTALKDVFQACLEHVRYEEQVAAEDELFSNQDELLTFVVDFLRDTQAIRDGVIDDRPAADVLAERIDGMDWPEVHLIAAALISAQSAEDAARRWLNVLRMESDSRAEQES